MTRTLLRACLTFKSMTADVLLLKAECVLGSFAGWVSGGAGSWGAWPLLLSLLRLRGSLGWTHVTWIA